MDSAFLKRMAISNPTDWSRYADDPDGIINERGITREERRRQFQVSLAVGDPRRHAPRTFRPLFEETKRGEAGVDSYADGARIRFLRVTGGRFWDRLYLGLFGWFLLEHIMEGESGRSLLPSARKALQGWSKAAPGVSGNPVPFIGLWRLAMCTRTCALTPP